MLQQDRNGVHVCVQLEGECSHYAIESVQTGALEAGALNAVTLCGLEGQEMAWVILGPQTLAMRLHIGESVFLRT